jgi:hypothetical protein
MTETIKNAGESHVKAGKVESPKIAGLLMALLNISIISIEYFSKQIRCPLLKDN